MFKRTVFLIACSVALAMPAIRAVAADDVGVRNLKLVKIGHNQFISGVGYNKTDQDLPAVAITFELTDKNGKAVAVQTNEFVDIGPGQAWRIFQQTQANDVVRLHVTKIESLDEASGTPSASQPANE